MKKNTKLNIKGTEVTVFKSANDDYISLTDIAKTKGKDSRAADIIKNWIRNRGTIEFIGTWEQLNIPNFKVVEFDHFKKPNKKGNMRDHANVSQQVCLAKLENLNAVLIQDKLSQKERLLKLNQIAISQIKILLQHNSPKQLENTKSENV